MGGFGRGCVLGHPPIPSSLSLVMSCQLPSLALHHQRPRGGIWGGFILCWTTSSGYDLLWNTSCGRWEEFRQSLCAVEEVFGVATVETVVAPHMGLLTRRVTGLMAIPDTASRLGRLGRRRALLGSCHGVGLASMPCRSSYLACLSGCVCVRA